MANFNLFLVFNTSSGAYSTIASTRDDLAIGDDFKLICGARFPDRDEQAVKRLVFGMEECIMQGNHFSSTFHAAVCALKTIPQGAAS